MPVVLVRQDQHFAGCRLTAPGKRQIKASYQLCEMSDPATQQFVSVGIMTSGHQCPCLARMAFEYFIDGVACHLEPKRVTDRPQPDNLNIRKQSRPLLQP